MLVKTLISSFVFILLAVSLVIAQPDSPDNHNIEDRILIHSLNLSSFGEINGGIYLTPDGTQFFTNNGTNLTTMFTMSIPFQLNTTNLTSFTIFELTPLFDFSFFDFGGFDFYGVDTTDPVDSPTDRGSIYHYTLSESYNLSTATFQESTDFGDGCEPAVTAGGMFIHDASVNFLGTRLYVALSCNDAGSGARIYYQEYELTNPYDLGTTNLLFSNLTGAIGGAHGNQRASFEILNSEAFYWYSDGLFPHTGGYFGMNSWNLSSLQINKSLSVIGELADIELGTQNNFIYKVNSSGNLLQEWAIPPQVFNEFPNTELGFNVNSNLANLNSCCFGNVITKGYDIFVDIIDDLGITYTLEDDTVNSTIWADFNLSNGVFNIITKELPTTFDIGFKACLSNTAICSNTIFVLSIIEGAGVNATNTPQNVTMNTGETIGRIFNNYFANYDDSYVCVTDITLSFETCILQNQSSVMFNEDEIALLNFSYALITDLVVFEANEKNGLFYVDFFACSSGFTNCISQRFYLTITGETTSPTSETLLDSISFVNNIFPDASDLSIGQKTLYVVISMLLLLVLVTVFGFIFREESGISSNGAVKFIGAFLMFLTFFFFIAINYIGVGILIVGVLIVALIVGFRFWKGGGNG